MFVLFEISARAVSEPCFVSIPKSKTQKYNCSLLIISKVQFHTNQQCWLGQGLPNTDSSASTKSLEGRRNTSKLPLFIQKVSWVKSPGVLPQSFIFVYSIQNCQNLSALWNLIFTWRDRKEQGASLSSSIMYCFYNFKHVPQVVKSRVQEWTGKFNYTKYQCSKLSVEFWWTHQQHSHKEFCEANWLELQVSFSKFHAAQHWCSAGVVYLPLSLACLLQRQKHMVEV